MMAAAVAAGLAYWQYYGFNSRLELSGVMEYSCKVGTIVGDEAGKAATATAALDLSASKDTTGDDIALEMRDAMETNELIYIILAASCIFSCLGGPILCIRWIAVPLQLLGGLSLNIYAFYLVYNVTTMKDFDLCKIAANSSDQVAEDAKFLESNLTMQYFCAAAITILASAGCYQTKLRDAVQEKKKRESKKKFK